jgi:hypothetical protein
LQTKPTTYKLTTTLTRANRAGSTIIPLPKPLQHIIPLGTPCHLTITTPTETIHTYAKTVKGWHTGLTPPKHQTKHLLDHTIHVEITPLPPTGWITQIGTEQRITIPQTHQVAKYPDNTLLELEIHPPTNPDQVLTQIIRTFSRQRPNRLRETSALLRDLTFKKYGGQRVYIHPKRILKPPTKPKTLPKDHVWIPDLLPEAEIGQLTHNTIVIFHGRHFTIETPISVKLHEIAHYMGCYFADGDKKANTWGISASTPKQAQYYINTHKKFVSHSEIFRYDLSYSKLKSDIRTDAVVKHELKLCWEKYISFKGPLSIRVLDSSAKKPPRKWNQLGSLRIRGRTHISLILTKRLLKWTIDLLKSGSYLMEALMFLCGLLEGDGSAGTPSQGTRAHLRITTNKDNLSTITEILETLDLLFRVDRSHNKLDVSIGLLSYLKVLPDIWKLIFLYYPKRRRMFLKRFFKQAIVRIMLNRKSPFGFNYCWRLVDDNIIDKDYNYTDLGHEVIKSINYLYLERVQN